jgi:hypothetical protein
LEKSKKESIERIISGILVILGVSILGIEKPILGWLGDIPRWELGMTILLCTGGYGVITGVRNLSPNVKEKFDEAIVPVGIGLFLVMSVSAYLVSGEPLGGTWEKIGLAFLLGLGFFGILTGIRICLRSESKR